MSKGTFLISYQHRNIFSIRAGTLQCDDMRSTFLLFEREMESDAVEKDRIRDTSIDALFKGIGETLRDGAVIAFLPSFKKSYMNSSILR